MFRRLGGVEDQRGAALPGPRLRLGRLAASASSRRAARRRPVGCGPSSRQAAKLGEELVDLGADILGENEDQGEEVGRSEAAGAEIPE